MIQLLESTVSWLKDMEQLQQTVRECKEEVQALKRKFEAIEQQSKKRLVEDDYGKPFPVIVSEEIPTCPTHKTPCVKKRTKTNKNGNEGRYFWACPLERKCFFIWCTDHAKDRVHAQMKNDQHVDDELSELDISDSLYESDELEFENTDVEIDYAQGSGNKTKQFWQSAEEIHGEGMKLRFVDDFDTSKPVKFLVTNKVPHEHKAIVDKRIQDYLGQGVVKKIPLEQVKFVAALKTVPRKDDPNRPREILNFVDLNQFILPINCELPNRQELRRLVKLGTSACSLDIQSCYTNIKLHPSAYSYCCITWKRQYYCFTRVPFGISCAPACCQELTRSFLSNPTLETVYLDDFLLVDSCPDSLKKRIKAMKYYLNHDGLPVSEEKSVLAPSTSIEYLGYKLDFEKRGVYLKPQNLQKLIDKVQKITSHKQLTVKQLQKFNGLYNFCRTQSEDKFVQKRLHDLFKDATKRRQAIVRFSPSDLQLIANIPGRSRLPFNY